MRAVIGGALRAPADSMLAIPHRRLSYMIHHYPRSPESSLEDRLPPLRFAQSPRAVLLRAGRAPDAQLRAARATRRDVRPSLRGQPSLHARAPRHPVRPARFPAPGLGTARAVRSFDRLDAAR